MSIIPAIESKLRSGLSPTFLEVINESHRHAGHHHHEHGKETYFDGAGETHLRIRVVSPAFSGKGRVDRHRIVNALLADEFAAGLHALAVEASAPEEVN
jgi:BolA protein